MSDIVKDLTNYRIKGIEKAEVEFYESLTRTLDKIEDQIVSLVDRDLPRQAGKLIELQSAVAIRPKIKAILDKEYLPFADRVVRKGFSAQAKRVERQFKTIGLIPAILGARVLIKCNTLPSRNKRLGQSLLNLSE